MGPFGKSKVEFQLSISIQKATNLAAGDENGYSDPYAILHIDGKEWFRTKVESKTLNPEWGESFTIPLDMQKKMDIIEISVWDKDRLRDKCRDVFKKKTLSDDFLGKIEIPVERLFKTFHPSKRVVDHDSSQEFPVTLLKNHEDDNIQGEIILKVSIIAVDKNDNNEKRLNEFWEKYILK